MESKPFSCWPWKWGPSPRLNNPLEPWLFRGKRNLSGVFANYIKQGLINYKKHLTKGARDYLVRDILLNLRTEEEW